MTAFDSLNAVKRFDQKADRIIALLELLATATLHGQGLPPEEIADLVVGKTKMKP